MPELCRFALFLLFMACGQAGAAFAAELPVFPVPGPMGKAGWGKWGYLKDAATGEILFSPPFSRGVHLPAESVDASILPAPDAKGAYGYVDAASGKVLLAPQFYAADLFIDGIAIVARAYPEQARTVTLGGNPAHRKPAVLTPVAEGLIDRNGREILPALYDVRRSDGGSRHRLFLLKDAQGATAVFHADKGFIVPPGTYQDISCTPEGAVLCDGVYYDPDGRRIPPPDGAGIARVEPTGLLRVRREEKGTTPLEGVMRRDGSLLVPVQYHNIEAAPEAGVWLASRPDAQAERALKAAPNKDALPLTTLADSAVSNAMTVDVYDASGAMLRSFRADAETLRVRGEHCTYLNKGRKHRVNIRTGEAVPEPEAPADPASGCRPFLQDGKYGIKNADGTVGVPAIHDEMHSLGGGLFAARRGLSSVNTWGVIDGTGKEILPFVWGSIQNAYPPFSTGIEASHATRTAGPLLCRRYRDKSGPGGYWLLDRNGRFITPRDKPYDTACAFAFNAAGLAAVSRSGKHGVIDDTGKEVLPCEYAHVRDVLQPPETGGPAKPTAEDALFQVRRGKLWGLYDGAGTELIPVQYGDMTLHPPYTAQGWIRVQDAGGNKHGLVNIRTGQSLAPVHDFVWIFPGFFLVRTGDGYGMPDRQGEEITRYDRAEWLEDAGVLAARRDGKYALLDANGKQVFPFRCDSVHAAFASFVWCRTGETDALVDNTGREYRIQGGQ